MVAITVMIQIFRKHSIQIFLFLFVNALFIIKYFPRAGISPVVSLAIYIIFFLFLVSSFYTFSQKVSEKIFKNAFCGLLIIMILAIVGALIIINPYNIRVDRWSALSFFWDSLLIGKYPYSTHTHLSATSYPSPFPLWHIINLPFYLLGEVGIGLIFFLVLTASSIHLFFKSFRKSFFFLLLLCISPAYWWEVATRSDSLNNALFVFIIILWLAKTNRTLTNSFLLITVICGLVAATRLTAILPLALYLLKPYLKLPWRLRIIFPLTILGIFLLIFSPFIFWDTNNWIFFHRNPFMSQADKGNSYILIFMLIVGYFMALKWKNIHQFFYTSSVFIFSFILLSQVNLIYHYDWSKVLFMDHICDISYFSLMLPYCLAYFTSALRLRELEIEIK